MDFSSDFGNPHIANRFSYVDVGKPSVASSSSLEDDATVDVGDGTSFFCSSLRISKNVSVGS